MRIPGLFGLAILAFASGCSKKKHKETSEGAVPLGTSYAIAASSPLFLTHSFDANTPRGLRNATSLALTTEIDACGNEFGADAPELIACQTMADIKERFFAPSPTEIRARLADLDTRLNGTLASLSSSYVPCLDAGRVTEGDFPIMVEGGTKSVHYPAFTLLTLSLNSTFKDGWAFNTGKDLSLSCYDEIGANTKGRMRFAYGFHNGTWSLYQDQYGMGMFGTADKDDSIDMWFSLGDPDRDAAQAAIEVQGGDLRQIYPMSTGIAHVISKPRQGLIGIALMGSGVGPGCGSRLIMNDSTLYFRGNVNNYGACFAGDFASTGVNGMPSFSAPRADVAVCMLVDGDTLRPSTDGIESCVKSGLLSRDENESIVSPFEAAGLGALTTNPGDTAALLAKAWMGGFFMQNTDLSQVPPLGRVAIQSNDTLEITGFQRQAWELERTTGVGQSNTAVSAKCNAAESARTATLSESFELSVADILALTPRDPEAKIDGRPMTDSERLSRALSSFTAALAESGDAAPGVDVVLTGSKGATYKGTFSGNAHVLLDGTEIGSGTLTLPSATGAMQSAVRIALSPAALGAASKFTVNLTGTLLLACDNAIETVRSVGVKAGLPQLVWHLKSGK